MRKQNTWVDWVFDIANVTTLGLLAVSFIFPFYIVTINSFTLEKFLTSTTMAIWPREISFEAYDVLFNTNSRVLRAFFISVASTLLGTVQGLIVITLFAYAMAKDRFPFKTPIMIVVIFSMMFSGGLIPTYLVFQTLGLTNSFYVLMIFNIFNAGYMIFIRNYFMSIPVSLPESARLDGASEFGIFLRIMLPLSKPMLACMGLFIAVTIYNDWTTPLFYNSDRQYETLQLLLKHVLTKVSSLAVAGFSMQIDDLIPTEGVKAATVVVAIAPILCAYPFVQKYFISGVWTGAMKE